VCESSQRFNKSYSRLIIIDPVSDKIVFEITPSREIVWEFFNPEVNKDGSSSDIT
jgi:hypothetical protein